MVSILEYQSLISALLLACRPKKLNAVFVDLLAFFSICEYLRDIPFLCAFVEYEEMQAAQAYVKHRKQIADVLHCVRGGDLPGVVEILEKDSSILEYRDQDGWNLLFHSIAANNKPVVRWILTQNGVDCNHKDRNNLTALHWAAFNGDVQICKLLVTMKADMAVAVDRAGCAPLHMAAHAGQAATCEWLYTHNPFSITQEDRDGATALHYAALQVREWFAWALSDTVYQYFNETGAAGERLTHSAETNVVFAVVADRETQRCYFR